MALSTKENRILELLSKKQKSGSTLSPKESRIVELLSKKGGISAQPESRSFRDKALEVIGGTAAGFTSFTGGGEKVGQTVEDIAATGAIPSKDPEAFRTTPLFETAGDIAGEAVGLAIGGFPGSVAGSGAGAGLGRFIDEVIRKGLNVSDIESGADLAKKVGISSAIGAGSQAGGRFAINAASKIIAPLKESVSKAADEALEFFKDKTRKSGFFGLRDPIMRPAQATDVVESSGIARFFDFLDNISSGSIFGSGSIAKQQKRTVDVLIETTNEMIDGISKSRLSQDEIGKLIANSNREILGVKRQVTDKLYDEIDDRVKDLRVIKRQGKKLLTKEALSAAQKESVGIVDISSIKDLPRELKQIQKELGKLASDEQGFNIASDVLTANDNLTFKAAKNARTGLFSLANNRKLEGKNDAAIGLARSLAGKIDDAIEKALQKHDPEALKLWRKANEIFKRDTEQFDNRFIRKLVNLADSSKEGNPSGVARAIFQPDNIEEVRRLKEAVDKDTFAKTKNWFVRSLFEDAQSPISVSNSENIIKGADLKKKIASFGQGNENDILGVVFNPSERETLKQVANTMALSEAKQGGGVGSMFIQLSQAGAIINLTTGGGGLPILVVPQVLGKVFTNPVTAKWLTKGYRLADLGLAGTPQFNAVMQKLTASIANLEREEKNRVNKTRNKRLKVSQKN